MNTVDPRRACLEVDDSRKIIYKLDDYYIFEISSINIILSKMQQSSLFQYKIIKINIKYKI